MTSASGGARSIQLSYGRYAVERGALLMMALTLSTLFDPKNQVFVFQSFRSFSSILFCSAWIQLYPAYFLTPLQPPTAIDDGQSLDLPRPT